MSGWARPAAAGSARIPLFTFAALLAVLVVVTSGCSNEPVSLVGTWTSAAEGETLDFRSDGTLVFTRSDGQIETLRWQADDSHLAIGVEGQGSKTLDYSVDEGLLRLDFSGEEVPGEYTRSDAAGG